MFRAILNFFTGGILDRAFGVIEKKIEGENDRERLKADVVKTWLQNRLQLPWWVDASFIFPLAFWWGAVIVYSVLWHVNGPFPQTWDIAALPSPLDEWAGWIIAARFAPALIARMFGK